MADKLIDPTKPLLDKSTLVNLGLGYTDADNVANPIEGATSGIGIKTFLMDASTPMVFPPAIVIILSTPTMYDKFPARRQLLRALLESHAKEFTGFDVEYNMDTAETPAGHDSQNQGVPTRNKRNAIAPSAIIPEIQGNLVWRFFTTYGFHINHPDTQAAFSHLSEDEAPAFTSSAYSMTAAIIQPDPSMIAKNIVDGVFLTNMFPLTSGALGLQKVVNTSNTYDRTINFHAILRHNEKTRELIIQIAKELKLGQLRKGPDSLPTQEYLDRFVKSSNLASEIAKIV